MLRSRIRRLIDVWKPNAAATAAGNLAGSIGDQPVLGMSRSQFEYQLDLDPTRPLLKGRTVGKKTREFFPETAGPGGRAGAPLASGEYLLTPGVAIGTETVLSVALQPLPGAAGKVEVSCGSDEAAGSAWTQLLTLAIDPAAHEVRAELSLAGYAGRTLRIKIERHVSGTGTVQLELLRIAPRHRSGRVNALSSYDYRLRNEVANFSGNAYTHDMYGETTTTASSPGIVKPACVQDGDISKFIDLMRQRVAEKLQDLQPMPGEVSFNFALRALGLLLPMQPPNFFARASKLKHRGPLRILSILSGAARIEEQLLDYCGDNVEITLIDASPDLIERAANKMRASHPKAAIECLVGDINHGLPGSGHYDVILCVSALHHVANLELVLSQINARLKDDGEFWSIGEQIGRNGNRLWPEALAAANEAFSQLPARLRKNAHTGATDAALSDWDFSTGCFEGIRSEELESMLEAHFLPDHVYKRNAFLWRLVDAAYGDNFVLTDEDDLGLLKDLVTAEALHWVHGGRATELHGVYLKKHIALQG